MKSHIISTNPRARCRAATLIECLVYIGVMTTILVVASIAFYRCYDHMRALRRNADDITRVLHIGELWRTDIRMTVRQPTLDEADLHDLTEGAIVQTRLLSNAPRAVDRDALSALFRDALVGS